MATPASPSPKSTAQTVRDTLESILIAFILAFVFRAFIVEAFVIPTGSMAATLYGDQVTCTCSTCGFEYARGITENDVRAVHENLSRSPRSLTLRCPNCDTMADEIPPERIVRPDSGDRILVHKWPFDIGGALLGPQRWDVTVFKDPRDGQTNFIKRLVGLPGEILQIIDGDVFAAPLQTVRARDPGLIDAFEQLRLDIARHASGEAPMDRDAASARLEELGRRVLPMLEIQRKTRRAQDALWMIVYDHDFLPDYGHLRTGDQQGPRWEPVGSSAGAWNTAGREVVFRVPDDNPAYIQFAGRPIADFYAYNHPLPGSSRGGADCPVGDLRLRFTWFPEGGDGSLVLQMNRDDHTFFAYLSAEGTVRIDHHCPALQTPGNRQMLGREARTGAFTPGRAFRVEFCNVDCRASVRVNGTEVAAGAWTPDLERAYRRGRNGEQPRPSEVRIGARKLAGRLRHVVLERDVYYRSVVQNEAQSHPAGRTGPPGSRDVVTNPFVGWPGWGTTGCPILLRDQPFGEYFMLGDNSPASKDSRLWWEIGPHLKALGQEYKPGTVPEDQLIGKAFFVYWPAGYRPDWSPGIGLIPNVGRMRWIR